MPPHPPPLHPPVATARYDRRDPWSAGANVPPVRKIANGREKTTGRLARRRERAVGRRVARTAPGGVEGEETRAGVRGFPALTAGQRYRLAFHNRSNNDHPVHLHRHSFELRNLPGHAEIHGILKDVILLDAGTQVEVEFTADDPGPTLFHCNQQNHMDAGFMMLFHYV